MEFHEKLQELRKRRGTYAGGSGAGSLCVQNCHFKMGVRERVSEH